MEVKFHSPALLVKDISVSRQFYEKLLQQKVKLDNGRYVSFAGGFSLWQIDLAYEAIFGNSYCQGKPQNNGHQFELYFETDNLDDVYTELSGNMVEMLHDIAKQPWGQRVFRVYDPDKYIVEIGEPMNIL